MARRVGYGSGATFSNPFKDCLLPISQGTHASLKEKGVPHVWNVDGPAHDPTEWRNNLSYFLQRLFR